MIIVSIIIHVKVDRRLNVTNKFIYQRRLSSRLAIVMLIVGHPVHALITMSDLQFMTIRLPKVYIRPAIDDQPTYKKCISDLQKVYITYNSKEGIYSSKSTRSMHGYYFYYVTSLGQIKKEIN